MKTALIASILTVCAHGALAATIHVPGDHPTIPDAVEAAVDGDLILVAPGTWDHTVNYRGRDLTIRSTDGPEVTVITSDPGRACVVIVDGVDAVLDGFTITGGTSGGVWAINSDAYITNNVITGNSHVEGNLQSGGGVLIYNNSTTVLDQNVIEDNVATNGGGVAVVFTLSGDVPSMGLNVIRNNVAQDFGGGIMVDNGVALVCHRSPKGLVAIFFRCRSARNCWS